MRYFFSSTRPEPSLSIRIRVPATARCAVAFGGSAQRGRSRLFGAAVGAIDVTAIAITTDNHLAVAPRALIQPGTGRHRHEGPMRAGFLPALVGPWVGCAKARFGA